MKMAGDDMYLDPANLLAQQTQQQQQQQQQQQAVLTGYEDGGGDDMYLDPANLLAHHLSIEEDSVAEQEPTDEYLSLRPTPAEAAAHSHGYAAADDLYLYPATIVLESDAESTGTSTISSKANGYLSIQKNLAQSKLPLEVE